MRGLPYVLLAVSAAIFPYCVDRIFLHTPIEKQMGTVQKIFYFHVPLAWLMMALAVACGVAAAIGLRSGSRKAEAVSMAAAELVLVTGLGVLITGPIWGHATWGKAWTWDARQVTTGLLWLIFAAYVLVRRYGAAGSDRLAAALAIFGVAALAARRCPPASAPLALAGTVFVISLAFRMSDIPFCPSFPLGTHFVWHCLNALVLYLLIRILVLFAPLARAAEPAGARGG